MSNRRAYGFGKGFSWRLRGDGRFLRVFVSETNHTPPSVAQSAAVLLISIQFAMQSLDLPNEIIEEIIKYLEQKDIYSVIRVNRRLHFLFSDYLLRYNVRHLKGRALTWAVVEGHVITRDRRITTNRKGDAFRSSIIPLPSFI
jgi:hypothetical protein